MTTNKPGSVNQQPHYGCTSCYEDWAWPADHLRVYDNECWCGPCWDERRWELPGQPDWDDLGPYTPALQAECENLRKHLQSLIDQTTPLEPVPGNPMWSRRIQLDEVIAERDSLRAECEKLRKDAERYRWLTATNSGPIGIVIYDEDGGMDIAGSEADKAIDDAMQGDKP